MNLSRHQQGDWLYIPALTGTAWPVDSGGVRSIPTATYIDENQDIVAAGEALKPSELQPGLHSVERQLGPEFPEGRYTVIISWNDASGADNRSLIRTFEVVPGGHPSGAYVGISYYAGHNADYILGLTDCGQVDTRKGPVV